MKEIQATAPTRKELYQKYKRVSEENERLTKQLKLSEDVLRSCDYYDVYECFLYLTGSEKANKSES